MLDDPEQLARRPIFNGVRKVRRGRVKKSVRSGRVHFAPESRMTTKIARSSFGANKEKLDIPGRFHRALVCVLFMVAPNVAFL
jgi:hypothetical protein